MQVVVGDEYRCEEGASLGACDEGVGQDRGLLSVDRETFDRDSEVLYL